ncbi:MAG: AAA family ATPase [Actinomycetota bacterium]
MSGVTDEELVTLGLDDPDVHHAVAAAHRETSWEPLDVGPAIRGDVPEIRPTLLARSDGEALLYPGRTHSLAGEPESGKSWVALAACADEIRKGSAVVYCDFEDSVGAAIERLRALRVPDHAISERFLFVSPEESARPHELDWVLDVRPALVVVDGVNASIVLQGYDPQDTAGTESWRRRILTPFRSSGAAILALDHVVKSKESRGRYAFGSQHKLGALDGAAYLIESISPFSRTHPGVSRVTIAKDRPGWVRAFAKDRKYAADFRLVPHGDGTVEAGLFPPAERILSDELNPAARRVLAVLSSVETNALSQRQIGDKVAQDGDSFGPLKAKTIDDGLRRLLQKELVDSTGGGRGRPSLWWRCE